MKLRPRERGQGSPASAGTGLLQRGGAKMDVQAPLPCSPGALGCSDLQEATAAPSPGGLLEDTEPPAAGT